MKFKTFDHRYFGWRPDLPDHRDLHYALRAPIADLPKSVDLRPELTFPVYNQGALGSCTANAIAAAVQHLYVKGKDAPVDPSRLFIYYNERLIEGAVQDDAGACIRDGIKVIHEQGVCPESEWPYDINKFAAKPPDPCYTDALKTPIQLYQRVLQDKASLLGCLAEGYPFVFGFSVYASFQAAVVAQTGMVPLPAEGEALLGGHAVLGCGYDTTLNRLLVRNSWGDGWGLGGYFWLPFSYMLSNTLADDFWTLRGTL